VEIEEFLLNQSNKQKLAGLSVAERLKKLGKKQLWNDRPAGVLVNVIVIHSMNASETKPEDPLNVDATILRFIERDVSSHYLIFRNGRIIRLVPEEKRAWHCGGSIMPAPDSRKGVNDFSIGIELHATEDSGFSDHQYSSLIALCKDIRIRYNHTFSFVGHSDIAGKEAVTLGLRADEKTDPGLLFDWQRFKKAISID
jgi:N-acetyl-anhydromuramoyl-L-alanine amidase